MKTPTKLLTLLLLTATPLCAQELADSKTLLQQGLFAEEAEQHLDKAAESYARIIGNYATERDYAVVAIFRLAEVRRKQERADEAAKFYQRVLAEFPQSEPQARMSKEALKAMGVSVDAAPMEIPNDPDEDRELRRLMMLAENSPDRVWEKVSPRLPKNMSSHDISPLANAAALGWTRVGTWLLDHTEHAGKDPVERDLPLYRAAQKGHLGFCRLLVDRGAEIEGARGVLVDAIQEGFDLVANWLVENGIDIDRQGQGYLEAIDGSTQDAPDWRTFGTKRVPRRVTGIITPLTAAIASDNKAWVDRLLELKADVNGSPAAERDTIGPLAVACWKGHAPLVRRLLEAGADPKLRDSLYEHSVASIRLLKTCGKGWTPLHYAATNPEILADLLKAGADPKAADSTGITPLHVAAHAGNPECVRLLVEAGADPNVEGSMSGTPNAEARVVTPLSLAAGRGDVEIAQAILAALLASGAEPFREIENGLAVAVGDVPANAIFLSEESLFPKLAEKRALSIAFPEAGMSFELAAASGDEAPPDFATALLSWKNAVEIRRPEDYGFNWENPMHLRREADGSFSKTPVAIMEEGGYPEMRWGDIIAFSSGPIDRTTVPPIRTGTPNRPSYESSLPLEVRMALLGSTSFEVKVTGENVSARTFTVNGGLAVRTPPWTTVPANPFVIFDPIYDARGTATKSVTVRRGTETQTLERTLRPYTLERPRRPFTTPDFNLLPGDEIIEVESGGLASSRGDRIALIEAGLPFVVYSRMFNFPVTDGSPADNGTLFEFIASAYANASLTSYAGANLDPLDEGERSLRVAARRAFGGQVGIITHPDFSSLRIRRLKPDNSEEIIEIPVAEFIAACGPDTPPAECRAKDIDLQPGDIVELKPHAARLGEPWLGFDEATARFFEKALTYDVRITSPQGDDVAGTVRWKAPDFRPTKAGPVAIFADPKTLRFPTRADAIRVLIGAAAVPIDGPLRDGMIIECHRHQNAPAQSLPRKRVLLPPSR